MKEVTLRAWVEGQVQNHANNDAQPQTQTENALRAFYSWQSSDVSELSSPQASSCSMLGPPGASDSGIP